MKKYQLFTKIILSIFIFSWLETRLDISYGTQICQKIPITIINQQKDPIVLLGAGENLSIPGQSQGSYQITPQTFYSKNCDAIYLIQHPGEKPQLGLLDKNHNQIQLSQISLRIEKSGVLTSNLPYQFSARELIQYEGLGPFLS